MEYSKEPKGKTLPQASPTRKQKCQIKGIDFGFVKQEEGNQNPFEKHKQASKKKSTTRPPKSKGNTLSQVMDSNKVLTLTGSLGRTSRSRRDHKS
jgi:hypothetical protein